MPNALSPTLDPSQPRRSRRSGYLYGCSFLVLIAITAGFLFTLFRASHQQASDRAASDASNLAWVLDTQLDTTLRHIQSNLLQVQNRSAANPELMDRSSVYEDDWRRYLISLTNSFPEITSVWVFDAAGDTIVSTSSRKINVADRDHFIYLRDHAEGGLFFSSPMKAKSDGRESMAVALRLSDQAGHFKGVVAALLDLGSVQKIFATVVNNSNNTISLRRVGSDQILVRQPQLPDNQRQLADPEIKQLLAVGVKLGQLNLVSPVDGIHRISAFRLLNDYPFYVTVGIAQDEAFASWRREVDHTSLAAALMLLSIGLVLRYLWSNEQQQQLMLEQSDYALREQQKQNQLLISTEQRHRDLLETLQTGVVLHAPDSKVLFCNHRAEELLGLSKAQMQGKEAIDPAWSFVDERGNPVSAENYPVSRVISSGATIADMVLGIRHVDKTAPVWVIVSAVPERDESGELKQIVVNFYDVTERKLAKEQLEHQSEHLAELIDERTADLSKALEVVRHTQDDLIRAEKLASLGSMVAGISHELNTPLGNALLAATTMEQLFTQIHSEIHAGTFRRTSFDEFLESGREMASLITRSSRRAADMIASFKQVAVDQTSEQRRIFLLDQVINDNLSALKLNFKTNQIEIRNLVPAEIECNSYPGPLGQVLTNLVQNAIVHGFGDSGRGLITISASIEAQMLTLRIQDDGVGMAPDVLAHIFDPFFTTRLGRGGSGLGLSISHRIATSILGGDLKADSTLHQGAAFILTFPAVAPFRL